MSDQTFHILALIIYFAAMLGIGWYFIKKNTSLDEYMLGGRGLPPPVAALSAGASDMSGWLLMGLPGAIYFAGLVEAWIAVGLTVGAWLNWLLIAPRLRVYTQVSENSITIPSFFENRLRDKSRLLRIAAGIIILVFFTFYVSSGMVAGGVFAQSSFGLEYRTGMLIVASVTVLYTLGGGFLAASYTDFVQGTMMFLALIAVPVVGLLAVGGPAEAVASIREVDPALLRMIGAGTSAIVVISALAWGLGYSGQPHIIVRFMALRTMEEAKTARRIGISWMILAVAGAIATALVGVAYVQQNAITIEDPETVFLILGQILFHPLIAGIVLAAVLAAIMSTISSQLIVSASALVEDLFKVVLKRGATDRQEVMLGRAAVLVVSLVAAAMAWTQNDTILGLVAFAWAGFGAAFGPTVILSLYWRRLSAAGALVGMVGGAVTVGVWGNIEGGIFDLYEILPGFLVNLVLAVVVSRMTHRADTGVTAEFDETMRIMRSGSGSVPDPTRA